CSTPQTRQIHRGLLETEELVANALSHLHTHGRSSSIFKKYFGDSPTAEPIGWFSRILYAAKPGALLRCDDPDGNCANDPTWAGHHRGSNATEETVICPPSYTLRLPLSKFCDGTTVAGNKTNIFWASDLLHRLLHVPGVSEEAVLHYSDGYQEVLDWAASKNETVRGLRTRNSDGVIYFALEAYAESVVPGGGCVGEVVGKGEVVKVEDKKEDKKDGKVEEEEKDCHSHDDGTVHCV
ncbi:zincin, partial [Ascobolus immersus RN42]